MGDGAKASAKVPRRAGGVNRESGFLPPGAEIGIEFQTGGENRCGDAGSPPPSPSPRGTDGSPRRHARRQIRSRQRPGVPLRNAGDRPPRADAEGARPARRPEHGGLHLGISRLAARRPRLAALARRRASQEERHRLPARPQRGLRGDRGLGLSAVGASRRGPLRRRLLDLVRQGARRRPVGRRAPPRKLRRHFAKRRRHRADGRRPYLRELDDRASIGVRLRRCDDSDSEPGGAARPRRLRAHRLGAVALRRHLGRHQMREGHGGVDRRRR